MVGLGKIRKLKIDCESFRDPVGLGEIHLRDYPLDPGHRISCRRISCRRISSDRVTRCQFAPWQITRCPRGPATSDLLAMLDQQLPELLDRVKQFAAALFNQYLSQ